MTGTPKVEKFVPQGGEAAFIASLQTDGFCDFESELSKEDRTLRGWALSTLLKGEALPGWAAVRRPKSIYIENAWIEGLLNLKFEVCPFALSIVQSEFTHAPELSLATLQGLNVSQSVMPGLNIRSTTINSHFLLNETYFSKCLTADSIIVIGSMIANGAKFHEKNKPSISLLNAKIGQDLNLSNSEIYGTAYFSSIEVGGQLLLRGVSLKGSDFKSLFLQNAKVNGALFLDKLPHPPIGNVYLNFAKIRAIRLDHSFWPIGGVNFDGLTYDGVDYADGLKKAAVWQGWLTPRPNNKCANRFEHFHKFIQEGLESDEGLLFDGKTYTLDALPSDFQTANEFSQNLYRRLETQNIFIPFAWRQYAKVLDASGNEIEARRVRTELARRMTDLNIERMKVHNANLFKIWPYRAWRFVFGAVSDYGLMPVKSLYWGLGLLVLGWVVFYLNYPDMVLARERVYMLDAYSNYIHGNPLPEGYPNFNPFIYSLDVMLPIVDFGQESHWRPRNVDHGFNPLRWYNRLHLAFGWFLSTIFVLGFTGLIRDRKEP